MKGCAVSLTLSGRIFYGAYGEIHLRRSRQGGGRNYLIFGKNLSFTLDRFARLSRHDSRNQAVAKPLQQKASHSVRRNTLAKSRT